jgi:hypothetical protein
MPSSLVNPALGPYSTVNSGGLTPALGAGFDVVARVPIDGRTVTTTKEQRNNIPYVYPGLEVFVTDLNRKFRFRGGLDGSNAVIDATDQPFGRPTIDAQWTDLTAGASQYKGIFDATTVFPGLNAVKLIGDFYIVTVAGSAVINAGTTTKTDLTIGDEIIWGGASWDVIPHVSALPPTSFLHTAITDWDIAVAAAVRVNAIVAYNTLTPYGENQAVYDIDATTNAVTVYRAVVDNPAGVVLTDATRWMVLATNDYQKLVNAPLIDNTAGLGSSLATPLDNGAGVLLDAKEIDRRIGSGSGIAIIGLISGGYARGLDLQPAMTP